MSFVGKSNLTLTPDTGEGIVVKNVDYVDRFGNQLFIKMVSEDFAELIKQRTPTDPSKVSELSVSVQSVVTPMRVYKALVLYLPSYTSYSLSDMSMLLFVLTPEIIKDCLKEEPDLFEGVDSKELSKAFSKVVPSILKKIILEKA